MEPGQQAGSGKAAAGFRIPRPSAGELVGRGAGRRTPCAERAVMAHSSPEPAARWYRGGRIGRACRRTPCAGRAVMTDSSPEPAAACSEGGRVGRGW
jgi:hypothetical protein